jgi:hypothetical protein
VAGVLVHKCSKSKASKGVGCTDGSPTVLLLSGFGSSSGGVGVVLGGLNVCRREDVLVQGFLAS